MLRMFVILDILKAISSYRKQYWKTEQKSHATICFSLDLYRPLEAYVWGDFGMAFLGRGGVVWPWNWHKMHAPPGNRTRVARMGILHDTTTPAVLTDRAGRNTPSDASCILPSKCYPTRSEKGLEVFVSCCGNIWSLKLILTVIYRRTGGFESARVFTVSSLAVQPM